MASAGAPSIACVLMVTPPRCSLIAPALRAALLFAGTAELPLAGPTLRGDSAAMTPVSRRALLGAAIALLTRAALLAAVAGSAAPALSLHALLRPAHTLLPAELVTRRTQRATPVVAGQAAVAAHLLAAPASAVARAHAGSALAAAHAQAASLRSSTAGVHAGARPL